MALLIAWLTDWRPWQERHFAGTEFFREVTGSQFVEGALTRLDADTVPPDLGDWFGGSSQGRLAERTASILIRSPDRGSGSVTEGLLAEFRALIERHGGTEDGVGRPATFTDDHAWFKLGYHMGGGTGVVHVVALGPPSGQGHEGLWRLAIVVVECLQ